VKGLPEEGYQRGSNYLVGWGTRVAGGGLRAQGTLVAPAFSFFWAGAACAPGCKLRSQAAAAGFAARPPTRQSMSPQTQPRPQKRARAGAHAQGRQETRPRRRHPAHPQGPRGARQDGRVAAALRRSHSGRGQAGWAAPRGCRRGQPADQPPPQQSGGPPATSPVVLRDGAAGRSLSAAPHTLDPKSCINLETPNPPPPHPPKKASSPSAAPCSRSTPLTGPSATPTAARPSSRLAWTTCRQTTWVAGGVVFVDGVCLSGGF
jgi:hypothetical protein